MMGLNICVVCLFIREESWKWGVFCLLFLC